MIVAFNSNSRYLDDLLNIDNVHFEQMVHSIYPAELQLNKANASDTEVAFLDLNFIMLQFLQKYDERDGFYFDVINYVFLDGDVLQRL